MNRERPTEDATMSRLPTAISIRRYRPADATVTRTVFEKAVRGTAARHYDPDQIEAWAPSGPADLVTWNTRRARAWTVVAVIDGEVVGFGDLVDGDLLDMLFVHPDAGGQGVARALVSLSSTRHVRSVRGGS